LLLQAASPGELAGVLAGQVSQALCSLFGLLLESQFSQTAPDAAYWPAMQEVQLVKGLAEALPAVQFVQALPLADILPAVQPTQAVKGLAEA
jgi:hypothetical protein